MWFDMNERPTSRTVGSDRTLFGILEALVDLDGATVTELADELDAAKSTIHQHLATLFELGYVVKAGGEYNVGLRFLTIGEYAKENHDAVTLVRPMVEQLAEETGERAQFFVEEHGRGIYLHTVTGERAVQANRHTGELRYLHSSAGGKAILAEMDGETVEAILDRHGLPAETERTITDRETLVSELEVTRERGYSINKEESITGLWAIGVPVVVDGDVIGAFSVSGPRHRLENSGIDEELPSLLLATANELEIKLQYDET
jgi:DNA-binding IclR family transcriptional regulator